MSVTVANLGFPRIGPKRELKTALEAFWAGKTGPAGLLQTASALRAANWRWQRELGAEVIPSNDFSLYDQVLDTACMVGAIPESYGWSGGLVGLETYFALARGSRPHAGHDAACGCGVRGEGVPALEMTKWFDTNYHYLVTIFAEDQKFQFSDLKPVNEYREAKALGIETRPVLLGPVSFLRLGKAHGFDPIVLLPRLLPVYGEILHALAAAGAEWVQIDEPCLVTDLDEAAREALRVAYAALREVPVKLMLTSYFGGLGDNLELTLGLPVQGLHVDLVRAPEQLEAVLKSDLLLSLGVIDGRNVWRADLEGLLDRLEPVVAGGRDIILAPSCSLLHVPLDLGRESGLDDEIKSWLAFAAQKIGELAVLARALREGRGVVERELKEASAAAADRRVSARIFNPAVRERDVPVGIDRRDVVYAERAFLQQQALKLPLFPTTTIGSFPQTGDVRQARAAFDKGTISAAGYEEFLRAETARTVAWQEEAGLDVLVHGEFERNDMVQYFGEQLSGFAFTRHAWVQSYGSRCVRPPILFGDVARPAAMTVDWWRYAQSLTSKPMKGMLTGPVTILNWSFVRDDQPREVSCRQIALAMRDEVTDLEAAGARIIQIDEAALREGLPLRRADAAHYLDWAVACFRITASGVRAETQIHTHMCYSEFNGIMAAIAALDADVISIETARSNMELLEAFDEYPAQIGRGVYDIHSPRVPSVGAIVGLLTAAARHLPVERIWVNPDCGLKTRGWAEVKPSIAAMVEAAREVREKQLK